ncbi:hypothetical protein PflCFBP13517_25540 [Pseudomonas fluorescens]|nr:hypothetical protein PflCFBP13517_25540 [Pseudomonas fluorescens]
MICILGASVVGSYSEAADRAIQRGKVSKSDIKLLLNAVKNISESIYLSPQDCDSIKLDLKKLRIILVTQSSRMRAKKSKGIDEVMSRLVERVFPEAQKELAIDRKELTASTFSNLKKRIDELEVRVLRFTPSSNNFSSKEQEDLQKGLLELNKDLEVLFDRLLAGSYKYLVSKLNFFEELDNKVLALSREMEVRK